MEYSEKAINILETSRKLFAKNGFKATTTKEIATASGVNELTIFRQFKNKDNLFKQVIVFNISRPKVNDFLDENEKFLEKYLLGVGNLIHTVFVNNLDLFKIELAERQKVESMDLINTFPNEIKNKMIEYLKKKHSYPMQEASVYSVSYMASVHGLCMNIYYLKTFTPIPDFNECLKLIIKRFK